MRAEEHTDEPDDAPIDPIAVLGLGAIGGSLARALVQRGLTVQAYASSAEDRRLARRAAIRVASAPAACIAGARTVVLAVPFGQIEPVLLQLLPALAPTTVVLHTGGLQRREAFAFASAAWERMLGSHPLAGSHARGFAASRVDLFDGAPVSVEQRASSAVRPIVERLWRSAGAAEIVYREAAEHDRLMSWISHLPQLAATAVAATIEGRAIPPELAGPGARDTTRLAASPLELWQAILSAATPETVEALEALANTIDALRRALVSRDEAALAQHWVRAARWRSGAEEGG